MQRVLIIGGGLAGSLIASRFVEARPELELTLLEGAPRLLGDKTWSFHAADLAPATRGGQRLDPSWLAGLASRTWDGYDVFFPRLERRIEDRYYSIRSEDLRMRLMPLLGSRVRLGVVVRTVDAKGATLADGTRVEADLVIDARGGATRGAPGPVAWQTFYGVFLRTERPHGILRPRLMDARVPQIGGFRFLYTLPFSEHELLIEDTRYADARAIDEEGARAILPDYLRRIAPDAGAWTETGSESGALPIPLCGPATPEHVPGVAPAGVGAGLYHPTTGYSLRYAALAADLVVSAGDASAAVALMRAAADRAWTDGAFYRRLNNMLFFAAPPAERWKVLEKFYRLGDQSVGRFYAARSTLLDRVRLLSGRPPVPLKAGIRAFLRKAGA